MSQFTLLPAIFDRRYNSVLLICSHNCSRLDKTVKHVEKQCTCMNILFELVDFRPALGRALKTFKFANICKVSSDWPLFIAVFLLAFFSVAGPHAVNLGRYAVLQAATLSFEQRGG